MIQEIMNQAINLVSDIEVVSTVMPAAIVNAGFANQVLPFRDLASELARLCSL